MTRWHLGHVADLTVAQDGVVARRQVLAAGGSDFDIARLVRRRELIPLERGVYVNHSGRLTQTQRHWAAVLAFWPAALAHASALPDPPMTVVHVAVDPSRNLRPLRRVVLHRMPDFAQRADLDRSPPAIRLEHALIDVISSELRDEDVAAAFAVLARVGAARRTTPQRILQTLHAAVSRVGGRWRRCSPTSATARVRCWSVATCIESSGRTGCREGSARSAAPRPAGRHSRMCATSARESSSSWTVARFTSHRAIAIGMRCVTSQS
ncbi:MULTISPECIES: hypothetical protein [Mycobacterium]|uniref:hypothetical protein n=1 Tax=Mycobacterium TaxID=1763 RepID=UPI000ACC5902|nr:MULTISPECIES: hypothetical protein [Mycobacterium]